MFEALFDGLGLIFHWEVIGYFALGCLVGILLGAVPGMGGAIGLVLLLPFTFSMEPVAAFALLLASWASTSTSGAITSVLLGVPSTAASQATILDGYPMAKRGEAARALGASFTASAIGGVCGALALGISLPLILPVILAFESPEQFMLGLLGLAMVGSLSGNSISKGVVAALFGLLLATIGLPESAPIPRYTFGSLYMLDKLPLIPVLLGLFAIPEILELAAKNVSIARDVEEDDSSSNLITGVKDAFARLALVVRCSIIGAYIGMLPGLGASVVGWVTYGHAKQSVKDSGQFGKGDVRGLLAPEAANNALRGGALIPTLTLGIPGSVGTAILMGALIMHGLRPGPSMLTSELPMTFSFVWMIAIASVVATLVLLVTVKQVARISLLPGHLVVPAVFLFVFMGAWLGSASMGAWITCLIFGLIGFVMKRADWPRPPVVLALVLGPILERSFQISNRLHPDYSWMQRPIVIILLLIIIATIFFGVRGMLKDKVKKSGQQDTVKSVSPVLSLGVSVMLLLMFVLATGFAKDWPLQVKQFPLLICIPGILLTFFLAYFDTRLVLLARKTVAGWGGVFAQAADDVWLKKSLPFFFYLVALVILSMLIGQKIALPLFVVFYLLRWGRYSKSVALAYGVGVWAIMVFFYGQVMNLLFHPSWLELATRAAWPALIPDWLFF